MIRDLMGTQIKRGCAQAETDGRIISLTAGELTSDPWFRRSDDAIFCWNDSLLGFYALVNCVRSTFFAVNFLLAGSKSRELDLFAPAIGSLYNAAFHGLHGFLALHGRVIFDSPCWTDESGKPVRSSVKESEAVIALLTKANTWKIEPRKRGHEARWKELGHVFASPESQLPDFLLQLFESLYGRRFRKGVPAKVILLDPDPNRYRVTLREAMPEFLAMIAASRHLAVYEAIGVDPEFTDALINGDASPSRFHERSRAQAMESFARSLLLECADSACELLSTIAPTQALREMLAFRIYTPWADDVRFSLLPDGDLTSSLLAVRHWIAPTGAMGP